MSITKQIKYSLYFLVFSLVTSCNHIKLDVPKNDRIDTVEFKGTKYLIPIPKEYCRYDPKNKDDQPPLNFLNNFNNEENRQVVALYEGSCELKKKVMEGELRDSPISIVISQKDDNNSESLTRKDLIDVYYNNLPEKSTKEESKKEMTKIYQDLTEEKLVKYGFSKKRADMFREDYKGYADSNNIKSKKDKDQNAAYFLHFGNNKNMSSYGVQAFTKIYNKNISVAITRTLESGDYNRRVANQLIEETKEYVKQLVSLNDKNDYKEFVYKNKKIKVFTPKDFVYLSNLKDRALNKRYKDGSGIPSMEFKDVFLKTNGTSFSIFLPSEVSLALDQNDYTDRNKVIEQRYQTMMELMKKHQYKVSELSKEKNGLFIDFNISKQSGGAEKGPNFSAGFFTTINSIPIFILAEIYQKDNALDKNIREIIKKELNGYLDLLDANQ